MAPRGIPRSHLALRYALLVAVVARAQEVFVSIRYKTVLSRGGSTLRSALYGVTRRLRITLETFVRSSDR